MSVYCCGVVCTYKIHLKYKGCILLQTDFTRVVCEYKHSYCTPFYVFTLELIMNVLEEDLHQLWKFHREQLKLEMSSLEGQLLLLQLNCLHRLLRV